MVLDTAMMKAFYASDKNTSKFPNITLVTSLAQIVEGSNVLVDMGTWPNIRDYFFLYEQIKLEPPKITS